MIMLQALIVYARHILTPFLHHEDKAMTEHEAGQGLVEYALILVLVSVAAMALMILLGPQISNMFSNIVTSVEGAQ
ncbi:MAG: Flp family type IVb pilin [Chloroflexota bacterium]